jgi:hypothetical protein
MGLFGLRSKYESYSTSQDFPKCEHDRNVPESKIELHCYDCSWSSEARKEGFLSIHHRASRLINLQGLPIYITLEAPQGLLPEIIKWMPQLNQVIAVPAVMHHMGVQSF